MSFPAAAREALGDAQLRRNMGKATSAIRAKRAAAVAELDDWDALREAGAAIKQRAMATLPEQLTRLEATVTRAGGKVHWARDGAEANAIIAGIVRDHGAREVIKVKSLATDEIGLNEALEARGIAAIETDLAELIVQLDGDKPSHILVPAIHRNRAEIAALFERTIAQGQQLGLEPRAIAEAARRRVDLSRPDRRDPDAAAARARERADAAVGVVALRRLLRGLSGQDRHSDLAGAPARARRARGEESLDAGAPGDGHAGAHLPVARALRARACGWRDSATARWRSSPAR